MNANVILGLLDVNTGNRMLKHLPYQFYKVIIYQYGLQGLLCGPSVVTGVFRGAIQNSALLDFRKNIFCSVKN